MQALRCHDTLTGAEKLKTVGKSEPCEVVPMHFQTVGRRNLFVSVDAALVIMLTFGVLLLDLIGLMIKLIELVNKQKDRK